MRSKCLIRAHVLRLYGLATAGFVVAFHEFVVHEQHRIPALHQATFLRFDWHRSVHCKVPVHATRAREGGIKDSECYKELF